jgi:hypothetical protein
MSVATTPPEPALQPGLDTEPVAPEEPRALTRRSGMTEKVSCPQAVAGIDLCWLPLGAGGHSVRLNGRLFEAVASRLEHRPPCDLHHSALVVRVPEGRFVIEMTPVPRSNGGSRGVVATGPVGHRWAGRFQIFRYEIHCWPDGVIPDVGEAVDSPRRLSHDQHSAQRLLDLVPVSANAGLGS